jgi:hypothetical protein
MSKSKYASVSVFFFWFLLLVIFHYWSLSNGRNGFSPVFLGGDDGEFYYNRAMLLLSGQQEAAEYIYSALLASLIGLTGVKSVFFCKFINLIITFLSFSTLCHLFSCLVREDYRFSNISQNEDNSKFFDNQKIILMITIAIYPSYVLFSFPLTILRDSYLYLLFVLSVLLFVKILCVKKNKMVYPLSCVFLIVLFITYTFRWYMAISLCLGFVLFVFIYARDVVGSFRKMNLRPVIISLMCIVFAISGVYFKMSGNFQMFLEYRNNYHLYSPEAGSNLGIKLMEYLEGDLSFYKASGFAVNYIYSFASNVFGPLPNQITSPKMVFALGEGFVVFALFFYVLKNLKSLNLWGRLLAVQSIVWFSVIALSNDNIGTAMRLRVPGVLLLLVLASYLQWKNRFELSVQ